MTTDYDVIIVGSGPAGLSAAHMLGRARRRVLVIDAGAPRNRFADAVHGVLGLDGMAPHEVREKGRAELAPYDVQFVDAEVTGVATTSTTVTATLAGGPRTARMLVAATGLRDGLPTIPGLADYWGTTRVLHCPYCHGWEVRGGRLGVLATDTMSPYQAQLLRQWSDVVVAFTAAAEPLDPATRERLLARGTRIVSSSVTAVTDAPDGSLIVRTADGDRTEVDAIFLGSRLTPHDAFLPDDLERDVTDHGLVLRTDPAGRTSDPRIWAAGNVANPMANVPMSMGSGSAVGGAVNAALMIEDTDVAVAVSRRCG